ncbi:hypothetical protein T439DRAFT_323489 [Meredithblackwellia eburnea MCA 4105]
MVTSRGLDSDEGDDFFVEDSEPERELERQLSVAPRTAHVSSSSSPPPTSNDNNNNTTTTSRPFVDDSNHLPQPSSSKIQLDTPQQTNAPPTRPRRAVPWANLANLPLSSHPVAEDSAPLTPPPPSTSHRKRSSREKGKGKEKQPNDNDKPSPPKKQRSSFAADHEPEFWCDEYSSASTSSSVIIASGKKKKGKGKEKEKEKEERKPIDKRLKGFPQIQSARQLLYESGDSMDLSDSHDDEMDGESDKSKVGRGFKSKKKSKNKVEKPEKKPKRTKNRRGSTASSSSIEIVVLQPKATGVEEEELDELESSPPLKLPPRLDPNAFDRLRKVNSASRPTSSTVSAADLARDLASDLADDEELDELDEEAVERASSIKKIRAKIGDLKYDENSSNAGQSVTPRLPSPVVGRSNSLSGSSSSGSLSRYISATTSVTVSRPPALSASSLTEVLTLFDSRYISVLTSCPLCDVDWPESKKSGPKTTHLTKCAKDKHFNNKTVNFLVEKQILRLGKAAEVARREKEQSRTLFERTIGVGEGAGRSEVRVVGVEQKSGHYNPKKLREVQMELDEVKKKLPVDKAIKFAADIRERKRREEEAAKKLRKEERRKAGQNAKTSEGEEQGEDDDGLDPTAPPRPTGNLRAVSTQTVTAVAQRAQVLLGALGNTGLTQSPSVPSTSISKLLPSVFPAAGTKSMSTSDDELSLPPSTQQFEPSHLAKKLDDEGLVKVVALPMKERQTLVQDYQNDEMLSSPEQMERPRSLWKAAEGFDDEAIRCVVTSTFSQPPQPAASTSRSAGHFVSSLQSLMNESPTQQGGVLDSTLMTGMGRLGLDGDVLEEQGGREEGEWEHDWEEDFGWDGGGGGDRDDDAEGGMLVWEGEGGLSVKWDERDAPNIDGGANEKTLVDEQQSIISSDTSDDQPLIATLARTVAPSRKLDSDSRTTTTHRTMASDRNKKPNNDGPVDEENGSPGFTFSTTPAGSDSDTDSKQSTCQSSRSQQQPNPVASGPKPSKKTSSLTEEMPDWSTYAVPKLQAEVAKYGFRISKERSVLEDQLTKVWIAMHPPPVALKEIETGGTSKKPRSRKKKVGAGEEEMPEDVGETVAERLRKAIMEDSQNLYLKVLRYEPIFFDEVVAFAADRNIKVSKPLLMKCLDEMSITFYTQDPTGGTRARYR